MTPELSVHTNSGLFFFKAYCFLITLYTGKHLPSCHVNGHNNFSLVPTQGRNNEILFYHQSPWGGLGKIPEDLLGKLRTT